MPHQSFRSVFRHSVAADLVLAIGLIFMVGLWIWIAWIAPPQHNRLVHFAADLPLFVRVLALAFLMAASWLLISGLRAGLGAGNWLMKIGREQVFIHYRSYLNQHLPAGDFTVIELAPSEIEWAAEIRKSVTESHGEHASKNRIVYVDLKLRLAADELERLQAALIQEHTARPDKGLLGGRSWALDYPVQFIDPGTLRITWSQSTLNARSTPSARQALAELASARVPIAP